MKIYTVQLTEEERSSIYAIWDSIKYSMMKGSAYIQDVKNVRKFLDRNENHFFSTRDLLKLCRELMEREELSSDGFKAIREMVRETDIKLKEETEDG